MDRIITSTMIKKSPEGEYVVMAYDQHGKRFPDADYHTDSRQDALETARRMVTHNQNGK